MLEMSLHQTNHGGPGATTMLLHMDSALPKEFVDEAGHTCSFSNPASNRIRVGTDLSKFGTGSLMVSGAITATHALINSTEIIPEGFGDFTIEFYHYWTNGANGSGYELFTCGNIKITHNPGASIYGVAFGSGQQSFVSRSTKTWAHLALVRENNVLSAYVDGVRRSNSQIVYSVPKNPIKLFNSDSANSNYQYAARLDEVRVSNFARYTTAFTPPTAPFELD